MKRYSECIKKIVDDARKKALPLSRLSIRAKRMYKEIFNES